MYAVTYSKQAAKELEKLDKSASAMIYRWIDRNLMNCRNPRIQGRALVGNKRGYWRYRVGAYRLIATIHDDIITIEIVNVAHRREVYE